MDATSLDSRTASDNMRPSQTLRTVKESSFGEEEVATDDVTGQRSPKQAAGYGYATDHHHKLEKKLSSGDLHSRLKTRKLLGVGETPDGDVHRSKLSQILGHSDQLYTKLPRGLRVWQYSNAITVTGLAAACILFPGCSMSNWLFGASLSELGSEETVVQAVGATRFHGAALAGLAVLLWNSLKSTDKQAIRPVALASTVFWFLHCGVMVTSSLQLGERLNIGSSLPRLLAVLWSAYYARTLRRIGQRSKSTCFTASGISMAIVSSATTTTAECGATEKKDE